MQCRVHLNDDVRTDWYSNDGNADRRHVAASGQAGVAAWRRTPAHERMRILLRAAELADERAGLKASGIGKEDPRSAVAEMTDVKTVILYGRPWQDR